MTPQALIVLVLWFPFTIFLCAALPIRKAIAISFLGAFLLLPSRAGFAWPLIPDYEKLSSTCYALIFGILLFDPQTILKYRFHWIDIPMIVYCFCNFFSSLDNDLGFYDGIVQSLTVTFRWGIPFFIGRLYFNELKYLKELAITIIQAGIIYVPLCLWEIRISPQLHNIVYGYPAHPSGVSQQIRSFGLWRPVVFTGHGLVASLFMLLAFWLAFWLWQSKSVKQIWGIQINWLALILGITFVMMQSQGTYAYALLMGGIFISAKYFKSNFAYLLGVTLLLYYMYTVMSGQFDGTSIVNWIATNISQERAGSLSFRWSNEVDMAAKARLQPWFGWGSWGRNRVYAYDWKGEIVDTSITDSIFLLLYGINGLVGVISFYTSIFLPSLMFSLKKYPVKTWLHPKVGAAATFAVFSLTFVLDTLLNAPVQPPLMMACGGLAGLVARPTEALPGLAASPTRAMKSRAFFPRRSSSSSPIAKVERRS